MITSKITLRELRRFAKTREIFVYNLDNCYRLVYHGNDVARFYYTTSIDHDVKISKSDARYHAYMFLTELPNKVKEFPL